MVHAIHDDPTRYMAPSYEKIHTILVDKEKSHLYKIMDAMKVPSSVNSCSIVMDDWTNA